MDITLRSLLLFFIAMVVVILIFLVVSLFTGDGGWKRVVTLSGVYSVCKPDKYPVVCFLDSDGKDGGMFCLPLDSVGGKCL